MPTGLAFRSISLLPKSDCLQQSRKQASRSEHSKAHRGNLSWLSLVILSFQYNESWFMFYIGLLLKTTLFHQTISAFLPFPRGLSLKEICWSLPDYIYVLSIFRISPLFFCVLSHNKYFPLFLFQFFFFIFCGCFPQKLIFAYCSTYMFWRIFCSWCFTACLTKR